MGDIARCGQKTSNKWRGLLALLTSVQMAVCIGLVACFGTEDPDEDREFRGVDEVYEALQPLAAPCGWTAATKEATWAVVAIPAIFSKRSSDGALTANGVACVDGTGAIVTAAAVKRFVVTGDAGINTVIIDFANGTFAPGSATVSDGIYVNLLAGANIFKIRGQTTGADTLTLGPLGGVSAGYHSLSTNTDAYEDLNVDAVGGTVVMTFSLGGGADTYSGRGGNGTGTGNSALNVTVYGGDGNDSFTSGAGNDTLYGDEGNDTFNEGTTFVATWGARMIGGNGIDVVSYASRTAAVTATIGPVVSVANDGEATELDRIDNDVETLTGGNGNDILTGGTLNDTLNGGVGDDSFRTLALADGADTYNGGAGTDVVDYGFAGLERTVAIVVTMDGTASNDGEAGENDDVNADVENCIGGNAADNITGNSSNNRITGGLGDDTLTGSTGDDTFYEGTGVAANGNDVFIGSAGLDTVDYSGRGAAIDVTMDGVAADDGVTGLPETDDVRADIENLLCPAAFACTVTGNASANEITGSSAIDVIDGAAGDDIIDCGAGVEVVSTIICGAGSDITFNCDTGPDGTCEL